MEITAEQQSLLDTQFPPEIEKLAEAQMTSEEAMESLRAYGASMAEEMLMSYVDGSEELQKTASENKAAISERVEVSLNSIGANSFEKEAGLNEEELGEVLHKEAQAAAMLIAEGYFGEIAQALEENPELVKEAGLADFAKKISGHISSGSKKATEYAKGKYHAVKAKAGEAKEKAKAHYGAHKGKYHVGAAAAAGMGAGYGGAKMSEKKKK